MVEERGPSGREEKRNAAKGGHRGRRGRGGRSGRSGGGDRLGRFPTAPEFLDPEAFLPVALAEGQVERGEPAVGVAPGAAVLAEATVTDRYVRYEVIQHEIQGRRRQQHGEG